MRKTGLALIFGLTLAALAEAHAGHHQKIMGTVSAIHDAQLEVKATNGKTSSIMLDDKTKVVRGKVTVKRTDLRQGDRVVVTAAETKGADGKVILIAEEVRLGTGRSRGAGK